MSYVQRLDAPGPKKLLALDGGGIRGVLTLEVLARLEAVLREETGSGPDFVLADWFDYIGGTSTGAIIAAGLALGRPVAELQDLYAEHGRAMFDRQLSVGWLWARYGGRGLRALLKEEFGADTTFGSDALRTLLMVVLRNATTDSPWPLSNNPRAMFNDPTRSDDNLAVPLWQLVRASTAAPLFFPPERLTLGGSRPLFVDGGVTPYNNPALQLFLMATLDAYQLCWTASESQMLLVSIGTGAAPKADERLRARKMHLYYNATSLPPTLMYGVSTQQDMLCRVLGRCRHGAHIDAEVGDLITGPGVLDQRLFSYVRYDADLSRAGLNAAGLPHVAPARLQRMDSARHMAELRAVGRHVARDVSPAHFAGFLPADGSSS